MAKSVTRMDYKKNTGWYVRVKFRGNEYRKYFGDNAWGGYDEAFEAAIQWRDEKELEIGKPRTERMVLSKVKDGVGTTGISKAMKHTGATYPDGSPQPNFSEVYAVSWSPEPGVRKATSFSVPKYGEEQARQKAIALRKQKEIEIYGHTIS